MSRAKTPGLHRARLEFSNGPERTRGEAVAGRLGLTGVADPVAVYLRATEDAVSAATRRAVKADLEAFAAWCRAHRLAPLPAEPASVAAFVNAMARVRAAHGDLRVRWRTLTDEALSRRGAVASTRWTSTRPRRRCASP